MKMKVNFVFFQYFFFNQPAINICRSRAGGLKGGLLYPQDKSQRSDSVVCSVKTSNHWGQIFKVRTSSFLSSYSLSPFLLFVF